MAEMAKLASVCRARVCWLFIFWAASIAPPAVFQHGGLNGGHSRTMHPRVSPPFPLSPSSPIPSPIPRIDNGIQSRWHNDN